MPDGKCSVKKDVLRNFIKFTEKHLCQNFFFNKRPCKFCEISKEHLFHITPRDDCFYSTNFSVTESNVMKTQRYFDVINNAYSYFANFSFKQYKQNFLILYKWTLIIWWKILLWKAENWLTFLMGIPTLCNNSKIRGFFLKIFPTLANLVLVIKNQLYIKVSHVNLRVGQKDQCKCYLSSYLPAKFVIFLKIRLIFNIFILLFRYVCKQTLCISWMYKIRRARKSKVL